VYALYHPVTVPAFFQVGLFILLGAAVFHFLVIALFGRLPRLMGWILIVAYGVFLYKGLLK